jgi:hypothetical protein
MFKTPFIGAVVHFHPIPERDTVFPAIVIDAWGENYASVVTWNKDGRPTTYYGLPFIQHDQRWPTGNYFLTWPNAMRDGANRPYRDESADEQIDVQGDSTEGL